MPNVCSALLLKTISLRVTVNYIYNHSFKSYTSSNEYVVGHFLEELLFEINIINSFLVLVGHRFTE